MNGAGPVKSAGPGGGVVGGGERRDELGPPTCGWVSVQVVPDRIVPSDVLQLTRRTEWGGPQCDTTGRGPKTPTRTGDCGHRRRLRDRHGGLWHDERRAM